MFLEGYKRNWLHTEGYSFEDRMIDDLSVSVISHLIFIWELLCTVTQALSMYCRKPWSKRKEMKRRRKKQSQILSTNLFCISVALL